MNSFNFNLELPELFIPETEIATLPTPALDISFDAFHLDPAKVCNRKTLGRPPGSKNKPKPHSQYAPYQKRVWVVCAEDVGTGAEHEFVPMQKSSSEDRKARGPTVRAPYVKKPPKKRIAKKIEIEMDKKEKDDGTVCLSVFNPRFV